MAKEEKTNQIEQLKIIQTKIEQQYSEDIQINNYQKTKLYIQLKIRFHHAFNQIKVS